MAQSSWLNDEVFAANFGDARFGQPVCNNHHGICREAECVDIAERRLVEVKQSNLQFFSNKKVTVQNILAPHRAMTLARCRERRRVLAINDTTEVDFTGHPRVKGAG
jgi:hypothetical protein